MRKHIAFLLLLAMVGATARERAPTTAVANEAGIAVYFSPDGGCTDAIVARLNAARRTIDVQAYSFTSVPITKALIDAHARGVKVRALLDRSNQTGKYSGATPLANQQIPVFIDAKHPIAHNKIIIIDGATIITGSFNFTKAAEESNAENLLIIDGKPKLVAAYLANFEKHLAHAKPYERKESS